MTANRLTVRIRGAASHQPGPPVLAFGVVPLAMLPPAPLPWWVVALWALGGLVALLGLATLCWSPRFRRRELVVPWAVAVCCFTAASLLLLMPSVARVREAGPRMATQQRLQQIVRAMHSYADDHQGRLPPAAVYGKDGQPLLSWRVLLLPYLDQEDLYRRFRLDEPWDSPHNLALLPRRPTEYAPPAVPGLEADPSATFFQVFVGKGAAFEGREGLRLPPDFPDGTANTILVGEAGEPVPWTRPLDINYGPDEPLPRLGGVFNGVNTSVKGFHIALADGSVRFMSEPGEATLRALITRNGGDLPGPDW